MITSALKQIVSSTNRIKQNHGQSYSYLGYSSISMSINSFPNFSVGILPDTSLQDKSSRLKEIIKPYLLIFPLISHLTVSKVTLWCVGWYSWWLISIFNNFFLFTFVFTAVIEPWSHWSKKFCNFSSGLSCHVYQKKECFLSFHTVSNINITFKWNFFTFDIISYEF